MKYFFLTFVLLIIALAVQIKFSAPVSNPFAQGDLACLPMPPVKNYKAEQLLPPPRLETLPPLETPAPVQAAKIEIYDPLAGNNKIAETQQDNQADWGFSKTLPELQESLTASIIPPKKVEPIPVNQSTPTSAILELLNRAESKAALASVTSETNVVKIFEELNADTLSLVLEANGMVTASSSIAESPTTSTETLEAIAIAKEAEAKPQEAIPQELKPEKIETASLAPIELTKKAPVPNLYLPEGATDEAGAALTLIKEDLHAYKAPDESGTKSEFILKKGDKIRPITRLRNADTYDWIKFQHSGQSWWAQAEYFIRVDPGNNITANRKNLAFGEEKVDKNSALPIDYKPDDLTPVSQEFTFGGRVITLRKEAAEAFNAMAEDAKKEGLSIKVFSGFRDFNYQSRLYLDTVAKQGPKQDGTAAPGYSEHQLGTTIDISNDNRRTILSGKFDETPEGRWLHNNSEKYGFRKSYTTENTDEVGYKPEPWHYRYMGKTHTPDKIARK